MKATFNATDPLDVRFKHGEGKDETKVVGLPGPERTTGVVHVESPEITSKAKAMEVTNVEDSVVEGQDIEMKKQKGAVARTEMRTEEIEVPDAHVEMRVVEQPVTKNITVPETVKDVEMRNETVNREEVVLDQKTIEVPTTELRPVTIQKPVLEQFEEMVLRPDEEMREIKVMRPQIEKKKVIVHRPVEITRTYTATRPETIKKKITVEMPKQIRERVKVVRPEIQLKKVAIQVPTDKKKTVEYEKPVTVIRTDESEAVTRQIADETGDVARDQDDKEIADVYNWEKVPVGVPFTEMEKRTKDFTVTTLTEQEAGVRNTELKEVDYDMLDYEMESVEVEVTESVMREREFEITEIVLEKAEVDVEVSVMREVTEKWPFAKDSVQVVTTSDVVMDQKTKCMPELTTKDASIDAPRIEKHTEEIQKAVPVEREVMVEKAVTEMQQVEEDVVVEDTKKMVVQRPVVVHDEVTLDVPQSVQRDVHTQDVHSERIDVTDQGAHQQQKTVEYHQVQPGIQPTALGKNVRVGSDVKEAFVDKNNFDGAVERAEKLAKGSACGGGECIAK